MKYHYSHCRWTNAMAGERQQPGFPPGSGPHGPFAHPVLGRSAPSGARDPSFTDTGQVGSLAGAAHLLKDNAGVQRQAQCEQKSHVDHKGKSLLECIADHEL